MKNSKISIRLGVLALLVFVTAFSRLIPHPSNFAPVGAMALFGAAHFRQRYLAFIIPIVAMWLSDLALNNLIYGEYFDHFVWFYNGFHWTYAAFILIGLLGLLLLKKISFKNAVLASLSASILFFIVSNFGVWASGTMYPKDATGLISCYAAGLPFLKNTMMGDLVYSGFMFGVFEMAQRKFPVLRYQNAY